jgi:hypothetical protein
MGVSSTSLLVPVGFSARGVRIKQTRQMSSSSSVHTSHTSSASLGIASAVSRLGRVPRESHRWHFLVGRRVIWIHRFISKRIANTTQFQQRDRERHSKAMNTPKHCTQTLVYAEFEQENKITSEMRPMLARFHVRPLDTSRTEHVSCRSSCRVSAARHAEQVNGPVRLSSIEKNSIGTTTRVARGIL